ncbi:hypothetical protein COV11_04910 [Candidatus Woesearchaeota archaeon CG10_big_fil_rev_8_21_14_0_10_30_7]|nr:MAG: hypothetical protein COV11_04910 [Candidatus Woesearchaeota archaeon CG10_big_fil_rev_8_21_14_0_10_30_7]
MARFDKLRDRKSKRDSKYGSSRKDSFEDNFEEHFERRKSRSGSGRSSSGRSSNGYRRKIEMTQVTCSACGSKCEVPFKPTSSKPVYCTDCFTKKDKSSSYKSSNKELEAINQKLDKIMVALKIE